MKTVYKYPLKCYGAPEVQKIRMPAEAELLTVGTQQVGEVEKLYLWAHVDTEKEEEVRQIIVLGTGQPLAVYERSLAYISTFYLNDRVSVGHAFELVAPAPEREAK